MYKYLIIIDIPHHQWFKMVEYAIKDLATDWCVALSNSFFVVSDKPCSRPSPRTPPSSARRPHASKTPSPTLKPADAAALPLPSMWPPHAARARTRPLRRVRLPLPLLPRRM